jgi:MYXO-CTERM domain-containing protein
MLAKRLGILILSVGVAGAAFFMRTPDASACGCFAPPDPSVPIVQAGENILFGVENGVVTAHIQVQYAGPASEFGWLLPLPSMPEMTLGTDELFAQLIATTQPKYVLDAEYRGSCPFDPSRSGGGFGGASDADDSGAPGESGGDGGSPLVLEDSIGPYDFAILRADSKQPMLDWLNDNGYFIPTGTEDVVGPYIREGAFFLALRLQKGNDVGDLQPVVLEYQSDLPMIPIILTGVAANPDMGVQVWVLGDTRAIPRNYYHTRINDALVDWINFGANYVSVVTDAVDEAEGHRSFVTEYAGASSVMVDVLDPSWRFGDLDMLRTITDAVDYVSYLNYNGWPIQQQVPPFGLQYTSSTIATLQRHLPVPVKLIDEGITPNDYYSNFYYYINYDQTERPWLYGDLDLEFDPVVVTDELEERVVVPTQAAGEMFRTHSYLTRMFTTLSPEEMTRDPVFSYNPDLGDLGNEHRGRIIYYCDGSTREQGQTPAKIITEAGFELNLPKGTDQNPWLEVDMPSSHMTETLREEGFELVVDDNTDAILAAIAAENDGGGCSVTGVGSSLPVGLSIFGLIALGFIRRRRTR